MTSWFASALQTVREKSIDTLEFVRKDLSEFTTTVKGDAESYLNKVKSQPTDSFGISRIVSRLKDGSTPENDGGKHLAGAVGSYDRLQNEKLRIQNDESSYLTDPSPIEAYQTWCESNNFNIEQRKGDITRLLIDAPHVRSLHARLVPARTTYQDFWSRYYFRLHQLDEDGTKRSNLLKRAHELCNEQHGSDWDGPDDEWAQEMTTATQSSNTTEEQQSTVNMAVTSGHSTNEQKESDTVSGDSWEREFDETDLGTSKPELIPTNKLPETSPSDKSSASKEATTSKNTTDEFDDEWEAWS